MRYKHSIDMMNVVAHQCRHQSVDGEGNEDSLVLLLSYAQEGKSLRMLLTGDAELDQEREVVRGFQTSRSPLTGPHVRTVSF